MHGSSELYDVRHFRVAEKTARADFVACISDFSRSQLMGLVGSEHWHKLRVIHCGVEPQLLTAERSSEGGKAVPAQNGSGDRFEILNVGRHVVAKGQLVLLEAVADLIGRSLDVRLTVIGPGGAQAGLREGEVGADLQAEAQSLGIGESVRFAGAVGQDDIRSYYERADAFCLPSFAEGVPVVLMEAMAMGLPVVATNVMGVPELVDDGVNGLLVSPGRADLLSAAIERLIQDPELRERFSSAGRRKVVESFQISQSAEALARAFAEVMQSNQEVIEKLGEAEKPAGLKRRSA